MNCRGQTAGPIHAVPLLVMAAAALIVLDVVDRQVAEAKATGRTFETTCGFGCGFSSQDLAVAAGLIVAAAIGIGLVIHYTATEESDTQ